MSTPKRKRTEQESGIKIHFRISPRKVRGFFAIHIPKHTIKGVMRGAGKYALILLIFPLLNRPAVVVPESLFVVALEAAPYRVLDLDRQIDKPLISRINSSLEHIGHSKALSLETV